MTPKILGMMVLLIGGALVTSMTYSTNVEAQVEECPDGDVQHWDKIVFKVNKDKSGKIPDNYLKAKLDIRVEADPGTLINADELARQAVASEFGLTAQEADSLKLTVTAIKYDVIECATTNGSSGGISSIIAGFGLLGGGSSSTVTLDVDTATVQQRVAGSCPAGESIRAINQDGTVVCEVDDVGTGGGGGTVTQVDTGSGLTGGPITTTGTVSVATSGITSSHIADGTITSNDIASDAVGGSEIIGTTKLVFGICDMSMPQQDPGEVVMATCNDARLSSGDRIVATLNNNPASCRDIQLANAGTGIFRVWLENECLTTQSAFTMQVSYIGFRMP